MLTTLEVSLGDMYTGRTVEVGYSFLPPIWVWGEYRFPLSLFFTYSLTTRPFHFSIILNKRSLESLLPLPLVTIVTDGLSFTFSGDNFGLELTSVPNPPKSNLYPLPRIWSPLGRRH
jgi:hypothetical protein